jgi:hypothetical protein
LGDLSQLDVEVLRGLAQDVEGLVSRDPLAFDQDPLGLADQLSSDQGGMKVLGTSFLILVSARGRAGETGHCREQQPPRPVYDPEGLGVAGIKVNGS